MKARTIIFAEMAAVSLLSSFFTIIPILGLYLGVVVLLYAGKKYFLLFELLLLLQTVPTMANVLPLEMQVGTLYLNHVVFGTFQSGYLTQPSAPQVNYYLAHFGSINWELLEMLGAVTSCLGSLIAAFGLVYWKTKKVLAPRVRKFPS